MTDIQDLYEYICKECKHSERGNFKAISDRKRDIENGSLKCPVCYKNDIKVVILRTTRCANCGQTWRADQNMVCWCKPKGVGLQITTPHSKPVHTRKDQLELDKSHNILKTRVEIERLELINAPSKKLDKIISLLEDKKNAV